MKSLIFQRRILFWWLQLCGMIYLNSAMCIRQSQRVVSGNPSCCHTCCRFECWLEDASFACTALSRGSRSRTLVDLWLTCGPLLSVVYLVTVCSNFYTQLIRSAGMCSLLDQQVRWSASLLIRMQACWSIWIISHVQFARSASWWSASLLICNFTSCSYMCLQKCQNLLYLLRYLLGSW